FLQQPRSALSSSSGGVPMLPRRILFILFAGTVFLLVFLVVRTSQSAMAADQVARSSAVKAPLGLPPVPVPSDNPLTPDKIALGRRLYYDPLLSVDKSVACATCHHPDYGFSDGKPVSNGFQQKTGTRNSPT